MNFFQFWRTGNPAASTRDVWLPQLPHGRLLVQLRLQSYEKVFSPANFYASLFYAFLWVIAFNAAATEFNAVATEFNVTVIEFNATATTFNATAFTRAPYACAPDIACACVYPAPVFPLRLRFPCACVGEQRKIV